MENKQVKWQIEVAKPLRNILILDMAPEKVGNIHLPFEREMVPYGWKKVKCAGPMCQNVKAGDWVHIDSNIVPPRVNIDKEKYFIVPETSINLYIEQEEWEAQSKLYTSELES